MSLPDLVAPIWLISERHYDPVVPILHYFAWYRPMTTAQNLSFLLGRGMLRLLADTLTLIENHQLLVEALSPYVPQSDRETLRQHIDLLQACAHGLRDEAQGLLPEMPHQGSLARMSSVTVIEDSEPVTKQLQLIIQNHEQIIADVETVFALVDLDQFPSARQWMTRQIGEHHRIIKELRSVNLG